MATALTEPADREKDDSKQDLLAKVTALESRYVTLNNAQLAPCILDIHAYYILLLCS